MIRKLVSGLGVAAAISGAVALTGAPIASAGTTTNITTQEFKAQGTWVYIRWYQGKDPRTVTICKTVAAMNYPGHRYNCKIVGNTTQLWVEF